jgi:hypothetical protein
MRRGVELARVFTSSFPARDAGSQRGSPVDQHGSDDAVAGKRDTRYEGLAEQVDVKGHDLPLLRTQSSSL